MSENARSYGYLRISTEKQDVASQRHSILEYAHRHGFRIDRFHSHKVSSRKPTSERGIDTLPADLDRGDRLLVSELSRLGRSLGQIIRILDDLVNAGIEVIAIKEGIQLKGSHDKQNKIMIAVFGLLAELERDLISERTKEGMRAARKRGQKLGRPKGSLGKSCLDGKEDYIQLLLNKRIPRSSIAKLVEVSPTTLDHFIRTRKLIIPPRKAASG